MRYQPSWSYFCYSSLPNSPHWILQNVTLVLLLTSPDRTNWSSLLWVPAISGTWHCNYLLTCVVPLLNSKLLGNWDLILFISVSLVPTTEEMLHKCLLTAQILLLAESYHTSQSNSPPSNKIPSQWQYKVSFVHNYSANKKGKRKKLWSEGWIKNTGKVIIAKR